MARKKVNLQYISKDSTRRNTLKKRIHGLMKKAGELSILCNAKASIVIYGEGESVPQVFPSHSEAVDNLNRFKNMPDLKQYKKIVDQESFLLQRINKLQDQVNKSERDYQEREIRILLHKAMSGNPQDLAVLSTEELTYVGWNLDVRLKSISDRITKIQGHPPVYKPSAMQQPTPNITDEMKINGPAKIYQALAPFQQHEGWLDMVSSERRDFGALSYSSFSDGHNGATSSAGFKGDAMTQPFDLGDAFGCPWGSVNPGTSPSQES